MEVINLSSRSFKGLRTLKLPNTVYNTEGKIYIYEDKDKWNKRMHLVKRLYINSGPIFSNKLATINSLVDYEEQIDMPELVYPEKLLTIDREIVGFTMPYVPSTNLKEILSDSATPAEVKIKYLKDIGTILEKMEEVRKYADLEDFYLNDLHPSYACSSAFDRLNCHPSFDSFASRCQSGCQGHLQRKCRTSLLYYRYYR